MAYPEPSPDPEGEGILQGEMCSGVGTLPASSPDPA